MLTAMNSGRGFYILCFLFRDLALALAVKPCPPQSHNLQKNE